MGAQCGSHYWQQLEWMSRLSMLGMEIGKSKTRGPYCVCMWKLWKTGVFKESCPFEFVFIIIVYFENVCFLPLGLAHMKSLHTSLNTTHSECKPSTLMSSSTHSFQVFLFLPSHLAPVTSTFLQADTQSSTLRRSRHLNIYYWYIVIE